MRYRSFGRTGWQVSELGMGCAALGGGIYQKNDREAIATLQEAADAGINFFDTASNYSAGHSERLIGQAFEGRRKQVFIASKTGMLYPAAVRAALKFKHLLKPFRAWLAPVAPTLNRMKYGNKRSEFSQRFVTESLHATLKRLKTDYLDLYQLHNPSPQALEQDDLCDVLEKLKREGKIREYGISLAQVEHAEALGLRHPGAASIQVALNLLDQEAINQCLPLAQARGSAVIARVPFAQGLLTGVSGETKAEQIATDREKVAARKARAQAFRFLATPGRSIASAALQFVLQVPGVSVVIPGMSSRLHLRENLNAPNALPLTPEELTAVFNAKFSPA